MRQRDFQRWLSEFARSMFAFGCWKFEGKYPSPNLSPQGRGEGQEEIRSNVGWVKRLRAAPPPVCSLARRDADGRMIGSGLFPAPVDLESLPSGGGAARGRLTHPTNARARLTTLERLAYTEPVVRRTGKDPSPNLSPQGRGEGQEEDVCRWVNGVMRVVALLLVILGSLFASNVASAQSTSQTIAAVSPKVVKIFGAGGGKNLYSYGSGFLVSPQGHIVTVWSHILDSDTVSVVLNDGRRFEGKVVGPEPSLDLAVLKIEAEGLPYFDLNQSAVVGPGARVLGFSNAFKVATGDEAVSVIHGVIAAKTTLAARRGAFESPYNGSVYIVDAVTNNAGAAGGVLTTWDGRLVGMIGKELRNSQTNTWVNYVMPINELSGMVDQIVTGRFSSRRESDDDDENSTKTKPRRYETADFGIVTIPDVVPRTPAYIDRILPGSLAEAAGLQPNDLILFVGDDLVQSCQTLRDELGRLESGGQLKIVVRRGDLLVTTSMPVPRKTDE